MLAPKETNEDLALPDDACPVLNAGEEKEIGMQGLEKKNNSVNVVEVSARAGEDFEPLERLMPYAVLARTGEDFKPLEQRCLVQFWLIQARSNDALCSFGSYRRGAGTQLRVI